MRFLSFHVDYIKYKVLKKGRSKIIEEITPENKENGADNALALFISMEKQDEEKTGILEKCVTEIKKISNQLKVNNLVLLPFAHLFGELSSLQYAFDSMIALESLLVEEKFSVVRAPFGWFNELELKAKGHPLSRISRIIS
ncbi:MAG: threonyl-tRNA synthetase editing domain-containing protein [Promethearchaeota archaeon]